MADGLQYVTVYMPWPRNKLQGQIGMWFLVDYIVINKLMVDRYIDI